MADKPSSSGAGKNNDKVDKHKRLTLQDVLDVVIDSNN